MHDFFNSICLNKLPTKTIYLDLKFKSFFSLKYSFSYPTRKSCMHFLYKICTRCIKLIYTKFIQNVYEKHHTFPQTFAQIFYTRLKELWQLKYVKYKRTIQLKYIIRTEYIVCTQNSYKVYTNNYTKMHPTFQDISTNSLCTSWIIIANNFQLKIAA